MRKPWVISQKCAVRVDKSLFLRYNFTMSKIEWKGGTLLAPLPLVMVTCGDMEKSNIITASWAGITNSIPPKAYISVRKERYSYDIIKSGGEFAMNLTSSDLVAAADYCGFRSGRDVDKFDAAKLTKQKANKVKCPLVGESPLVVECVVTNVIELGSHDMFLADIVAVDVEERLLDKTGKLHLEKAGLVAFSHGEYFALGQKLGKFGYSIQKKNSALMDENSERKKELQKKNTDKENNGKNNKVRETFPKQKHPLSRSGQTKTSNKKPYKAKK